MDTKNTAISENRFHPLEIEYLHYQYMPRKCHVSLVHPGGTGQLGRTRLVNLAPQTALNLLAWLEKERETLEQLAVGERENTTLEGVQ